jgi:hypothetical protein
MSLEKDLLMIKDEKYNNWDQTLFFCGLNEEEYSSKISRLNLDLLIPIHSTLGLNYDECKDIALSDIFERNFIRTFSKEYEDIFDYNQLKNLYSFFEASYDETFFDRDDVGSLIDVLSVCQDNYITIKSFFKKCKDVINQSYSDSSSYFMIGFYSQIMEEFLQKENYSFYLSEINPRNICYVSRINF